MERKTLLRMQFCFMLDVGECKLQFGEPKHSQCTASRCALQPRSWSWQPSLPGPRELLATDHQNCSEVPSHGASVRAWRTSTWREWEPCQQSDVAMATHRNTSPQACVSHVWLPRNLHLHSDARCQVSQLDLATPPTSQLWVPWASTAAIWIDTGKIVDLAPQDEKQRLWHKKNKMMHHSLNDAIISLVPLTMPNSQTCSREIRPKTTQNSMLISCKILLNVPRLKSSDFVKQE